MRILWVKANKLLPVHSGGDIRSYHIAKHLAERHEFVFLSYYDGAPDPAYEQLLREQFPGAVCVCTGRGEGKSARAMDYLKRLPTGEPYAVSRFRFRPLQSVVGSWFQQQRFDVAVCDFLDAAVNFPEQLNIPSVLFQHNVESEIWRRHAETETNPAKRFVYGMEFRRILAYEQAAVKRFHHVIAVSEHDRKLMSAWVNPEQITVVPTGVDLEQYSPAPESPSEPKPLIVFIGAMDWEPNIDAVEYFCREIWPSVRAELPDAKFRIVGRNPDARVRSFAGEAVEITGRVPAVINHLREAAAVIVPLRIGGGTRLKIYEAMAAGKAVVSTSVGAEGLDVHDGQDIILADSPREFAASILNILRDRSLRRRYEQSAAKLASRYGWPAVGHKFDQLIQSVAQRTAREPFVPLPAATGMQSRSDRSVQ